MLSVPIPTNVYIIAGYRNTNLQADMDLILLKLMDIIGLIGVNINDKHLNTS